jgi:hypothetical protein
MESREFASYGYQADNSMNRLVGTAIVSVFITIPLAAGVSVWFLSLLLVPVGIYVYVKRSGISKPLLIAGRYLILGDRIMYFRNVTQVRLDKQKQILTISAGKGADLVISADKFPTNARKPDKIRINKTAKFDKVCERIITRLRAASPDIVIS